MSTHSARAERISTSLAAILGVLLASPAFAVDGVIEINQAKVDAAGGFPYSIAASGSYRLTSDLVVSDPNATAILIALNDGDVTIDLNGFAIRCPTCVAAGTGDGISAPATGPRLTVRNGVVRNMGNNGILAAGRAHIDRVRVESNVGIGISLGANSSVTECTAVGNGSDGIHVADNCLVSGSVANLNGGNGIKATQNCRIAHNVANGNTSDGIHCNDYCNVIGNQTQGNDVNGIDCWNRCRVGENAANENGQVGIWANHASLTNNVASDNGAQGIKSYTGTIVGNAAVFNGSFGLQGDLSSGYAANQFDNNNGGNANPQVSGGTEIGTNICGGDAICP
jgi:hypothetical protein